MPRWHFTRHQNLLFMNNERTRVTSDSFPAKKHMDRFVCRYFFPATQAVALTFPAHIVHDKPENIWKVSDILHVAPTCTVPAWRLFWPPACVQLKLLKCKTTCTSEEELLLAAILRWQFVMFNARANR